MKTGKVAVLAFALLAAIALSGCVTGTGASARPMTFADLYSGAGFASVAMVAVFLSMFFVALGYMFGYAFKQPQIVTWAKGEMYQVIASALLVAFMLWFVTAISSFTYDLMGTWNPNSGPGMICRNIAPAGAPPPGETITSATGWTTTYHIDCAQAVLKDTTDKLILQANQMISLNMRMQFLAGFVKSFDFTLNTPGYWAIPMYPWPHLTDKAVGIAFSPYIGLSMLTDAVTFIMPYFFGWIASFIAQEFILAMIKDALFPVLMVVGIILRTFFFTRKLGGLLLAIAICLYTVYPLMYILLSQHMWISPDDIWMDRWAFWGRGECDLTPYYWDSPAGPDTYPVYFTEAVNCPIRYGLGDLFALILVGKTVGGIGAFDLTWLWTIVEMLGRMTVSAAFIPLLITLVTVSSVKTLSPLLGGDVEIAGLTHLI